MTKKAIYDRRCIHQISAMYRHCSFSDSKIAFTNLISNITALKWLLLYLIYSYCVNKLVSQSHGGILKGTRIRAL
uniref:Uncharacterized protein n=1 Tax=Parascaris univalens TaxID=6257 RepID=A0A915BYN4_PARUN